VTLKQALQKAREILLTHHIENSSLTAEVLLRHTLNLSRVQLYQQLDIEMTSNQMEVLENLIRRHVDGEPVAYIVGHKEFYGIDFFVDNRALIPRPETEMLVDKVLEIARNKEITAIADIGTGSGAIAVALALNLAEVRIFATDVSALALELALQNCQRHGLLDKICLLEGDLLEPLPGPVDIIIANLPYIKESELNEPSIRYEPRLALNGGPDGLDQIRRFCSRVREKLKSGGSLLMEIGLGQIEAVSSQLHSSFPEVRITIFKDFNRIERIVMVKI
jgi:release factor glutamine methyltransferase